MASPLFTRWFQAQTFAPGFRGAEAGRAPDPSQRVLVDFIRLRGRFAPYIESAGTLGGPARSGIVLESLPADLGAYARAVAGGRLSAFAFGPSLRVHPMPPTEVAAHAVALSAGCRWFDFWTGASYEGGQLVRVPAPVETLPIFVSAGAIVPLAAVSDSGEETSEPLELRIYPGANGTLNLREAGQKRAGRNVDTWIPFSWDDRERVLHIGGRGGAGSKTAGARRFDIVLVCPGRGVGHPAPVRPDLRVVYEGEALRLQLPGAPARPVVPACLTAKVEGGQVFFSWEEPCAGAIYRFRRAAEAGGPYEDVASSLTIPRYSMPLPANGAPFHCVVTAMNAGGESPPSKVLRVVPPSVETLGDIPDAPPRELSASPFAAAGQTGGGMESPTLGRAAWHGSGRDARGGAGMPAATVISIPGRARRAI